MGGTYLLYPINTLLVFALRQQWCAGGPELRCAGCDAGVQSASGQQQHESRIWKRGKKPVIQCLGTLLVTLLEGRWSELGIHSRWLLWWSSSSQAPPEEGALVWNQMCALLCSLGDCCLLSGREELREPVPGCPRSVKVALPTEALLAKPSSVLQQLALLTHATEILFAVCYRKL